MVRDRPRLVQRHLRERRAPQALRHGDEIRVGHTRLLFRHSADAGRTVTAADEGPPAVTPREHDVLAVLCRPLLDRDLFTEPATVKQVAAELVVSEAAVKQHLVNLYAKFGIGDDVSNRRSRLANEAIRRAAITLNELRRERGCPEIEAPLLEERELPVEREGSDGGDVVGDLRRRSLRPAGQGVNGVVTGQERLDVGRLGAGGLHLLDDTRQHPTRVAVRRISAASGCPTPHASAS